MDQTDDQFSQRPHDQEPIKDTPQHIDESDDDFLLQGQPEERRGSRLGDTRVRIELPQHPTFRRVKQGVLEATKETYKPRTPLSAGHFPIEESSDWSSACHNAGRT